MIIDKIKKRVLTPSNLTRLAKLVTEELNTNLEAYQTEIPTIDHAIDDTTIRLGRLYETIESGQIMHKDLEPRIRELRERLDKLQARKDELRMFLMGQKVEVATEKEVAECATDLRNLIEKGSMIERKTFIRSFINEVKVTDSNIEVNYRIPTSACRCKEEKSQVLDIVHYGGRYRTIDRTFELVFALTP